MKRWPKEGHLQDGMSGLRLARTMIIHFSPGNEDKCNCRMERPGVSRSKNRVIIIEESIN